MPSTKITASTNISILDEKVVIDACGGYFYVDISPSTWIGSGKSNVLGAKFQIINPYGIIIKSYGTSYDVAPDLSGGMDAVIAVAIPTQAGKYQYGTYQFDVQFTDADGTVYYNSKSRNFCQYQSGVNKCESTTKLIADCKNGRLTVLVGEPPVYQSKLSESKTQEWTVNYPTGSGVEPLVTTVGNFSVQLFQGIYIVSGSVCATYNFGDNVYVKLNYTWELTKNVKCLLDYTCVYPKIKQLNDRIDSDCTQKEKEQTSSLVLDALRLLKTAELANDAGEDPTDYINDLESLLGCSCTCDCNANLPIINGTPSTNLSIEGCGVTKETVGLTDVYTINNYTYILTVDPTQSIITVSDPAIDGCTKTQQLAFSIINLYAGVKTQINSTTEYDYWASIINNTLSDIDASCLGYSLSQWTALTFKQKLAAVMAKSCAGGNCDASVDTSNTSRVGVDVLISWTQTGAYSVDVYVDGVFKGNVLSTVLELLVENYADGITHEYILIPRCENGSIGTTLVDTFGYLACPSISAPTVSSNNVNDVACPYDLTALVSTPPLGIDTEWHTANNTLAATLVPDPTMVSSGVYYAFAKDSDGCYSTATQVTVICSAITSCTAPQSLLVTAVVGGFKVAFQSAAFPPPLDSYTVKRRLSADPDISGSYTTIGTPVWNASTSRWEITDTTASNNTLYVYRAISNCSSTAPYVDNTFANITCPTLSLTPSDGSIDYSFSPVGGDVDKYEVKLYNAAGTTLIHTDTHTPAFSDPTTGTFLYLTSDTSYRVRVRVYIGTYYFDCNLVFTTTTLYNIIISNQATTSITAVTPPFYAISEGAFPVGISEMVKGIHSGFSGVIQVTDTTGSSYAELYINSVFTECIDLTGATASFASRTYASTDIIEIIAHIGSCT